MKKWRMVFCLCALLAMPAMADETCANGSGLVKTGVDGTRYCKSRTNMTWWSAFSWCKAIGGELVDLTKECNKATGTGACPNLMGFGYFWTQNSASDYIAYVVESNDNINGGNYGKNTAHVPPLCVNFTK